MNNKEKTKLVHSDISYKIIGVLFDVYNELGFGYQEKYYYKAIREGLKKSSLSFKEQLPIPIKYGDSKIGIYYLDFVVNEKVVLEIKQGERFLKKHFDQVLAYLKSSGLELGILAGFTSNGIKFKRVLNINPYIRKNP